MAFDVNPTQLMTPTSENTPSATKDWKMQELGGRGKENTVCCCFPSLYMAKVMKEIAI